jgi:hypothetical protein
VSVPQGSSGLLPPHVKLHGKLGMALHVKLHGKLGMALQRCMATNIGQPFVWLM